MIVKPMVRSNVCLNAHPEGMKLHVQEQIDYVKKQKKFDGPKNVLIIGGSAGYGIATRIAASFGGGAKTISVAFEKPASEKRGATVGWYASEYFKKKAEEEGLFAQNIYGDAFSRELKDETIAAVKKNFGKADLVVYSLASGVRTDPATGVMYRSVLKPLGKTYTAKSVNPMTGELTDVSIEPANEEEVAATVKVMGGEDWELWIDALLKADVLAQGAVTLAYSYIGPEITQAVYREGTIGKAKEHIEAGAKTLDKKMKAIGGAAYISVNKAVVTRASAVIPVVPLYTGILFKILEAKGLQENCAAQMYRMFTERLCTGKPIPTDPEGRIRLDDREMREDVQKEVSGIWGKITQENAAEYADFKAYETEFLQLHGFGYPQIDYDKDVEV
ncbi:MAG: trans-2-enoyl-CoA reductase family protein [Spirochaetales bacterium]|jgi:enoyl-[acyl-carrier protein] reductase/trans-2-enoyl-CoA reductase (NAD+)|nr:trans-2-enoyl-CoA reductase family protein [Spirochaetales bacterium]